MTLHFSIDSEFVTNLARSWLWDEGRPYEKCYELLEACLGGMPEKEKPATIISILEGRKKLVGVNTCEVVDDNKNIRPLGEYIKKLEQKNILQAIKEDMRQHFKKYVDKYATVKSSHRDVLQAEWHSDTIQPETYDECFAYYSKLNGKTLYDQLNSPTMCGLWLYEYPEMVAECCNYAITEVGSDTFWENIYQHIKNKKGFELRNAVYLAHHRLKEKNTNEKETADKKPTYIKRSFGKQPEYGTIEYMKYMYDTETSKEQKINYLIEPDNYLNEFSIIAPNGDYYSCSFAGHNLKAWNLLITHPERFGITIPNGVCPNKYMYEITTPDKALDEIIKHGWCALRHGPTLGYYITYPEKSYLTQKQIDAIFDATVKHDIPLNIKALLSQEE